MSAEVLTRIAVQPPPRPPVARSAQGQDTRICYFHWPAEEAQQR